MKAPIEMDGAGSAPCAKSDPSPDPTGAKEFLHHGLELDRQGKYEEALAEYNKALQLRPDYAWAYYDIGVVKDEQGKTSEAIAANKQALALDETHPCYFENLGKVLLDARQYVEAEEVLRTGRDLFPGNIGIMMNLGNALACERKYEEAIPYFRSILAVHPERDNARQSLSTCLHRLGRDDEAAKVKAEWPSYRPDVQYPRERPE